jgi:hypothetical protein
VVTGQKTVDCDLGGAAFAVDEGDGSHTTTAVNLGAALDPVNP